MTKAKPRQIDFKFSANWRTFSEWFDQRDLKCYITPWADQQAMIKKLFNNTVPGIIDWNQVWEELEVWFAEVAKKKKNILFKEQQRQIETLMLKQTHRLNEHNWVIAYKKDGQPHIMADKMSYWDAKRTKTKLSPDGNGVGGDPEMDEVVIINLFDLF